MSKVSPQMMANAIRALAMDAVQKAKSGHPGMPMGMADIATALWSRHLRFNPADPKWLGRDRFILSNGHGSMLQYALLHLTGYDLSMDDLKAFRQLGSKTPGHPEVHVTPGVETTTGPLGQGIANGVGMALAEKLLGAEFNREGFPVIDNRTYVFLGDGCLMEGISHEVCSLAGVWHLNKLIAIYDDNGISIDGDVRGWFQDDTRKRFEAYGWMVIGPVDGPDHHPAVGFEALSRVVLEPAADVAVDRNAVVVVDRDQLIEVPDAGKRADFVADAFHEAAVAQEHIRAVVDDGEALAVEFRAEELFGERHADAVRDALAERTRRRFDARSHMHLGVARGFAAELTESLEVVHREVIARQMQKRVLQHRAVAVRENEAVAAEPLRISGIEAQMARPERRGDICHAHRHAGVAGLGFLNSIHGERADRVRHHLGRDL